MKLTNGEQSVLEGAYHCAKFGWNFCTGRTARKRDALRLIDKGLLADGGLAAAVDGDGFTIQPERWRHSYVLTDAGREEVERIYREEQERIDRMSAECGSDVASLEAP